MARIVADEVQKSFSMEDGSKLDVLADVSLDVEDGEFVSLIGPSGCGKSTFLSLVDGLSQPDFGEIRVEGTEETSVGFVFQDPTLLDWKTVEENVRFALESMDVPADQHDERVESVLRKVGLFDFRDQYPQSLSGGMQQRLGLARALSIEPDVLLMDEPYSNLDEITARDLRTDLARIWLEENKTILFVTHNILEAVYLSDRVVIFSEKPASITDEIRIGLDHPRELDDPNLLEYEKQVLSAMGIEDY